MYPRIYSSLILALTLLLSACGKDEVPPAPVLSGAGRVLIACEGMLGNGNSALTVYEPDSNRATEDIYMAANGIPLGDVLQSVTRIGDRYFLCINNSDKILVVGRSDFKLQGSLAVPKPRYIVRVSDDKAYVSTLFSNKVYIINPANLTVTGSLTLPHQNPEGMLQVGNRVFVCPWDTASNHIYALDIADDRVGPGIRVAGRAPQEVLEDKEGMLWVLSGNKSKGVESTLTRLNPASGAILKTYYFGAADPVRPVFNKAKDTIYFIEVAYSGGTANNGIYRMGIHEASLPAQAFIPARGFQYFWGIGIHPVSGNVYVADPVGFTQRGKVYVHRPNGSLVTSFATGAGPGHFLFD